jgi:hypothetical protein
MKTNTAKTPAYIDVKKQILKYARLFPVERHSTQAPAEMSYLRRIYRPRWPERFEFAFIPVCDTYLFRSASCTRFLHHEVIDFPRD